MSSRNPRYFENPYGQVPQLPRAEVARTCLKAAAVALKAVKAAALAHRDVSGGGVYVGLGGIALTYLRISQQVGRGFAYAHGAYLRKHTAAHALGLARQLAAAAEALLPEGKRVTFLEGYSGSLALRAAAAAAGGDAAGGAALARELERYASTVAALPPGECELLYGRAGYLYSLLWTEAQLGAGSVSGEAIKGVVSHLLAEGQQGAAALGAGEWGLMYSWHGKHYLGAAHGLAGIVYVLLHCLPAVRDADGAGMRALRAACDALAGALLPSGNLPSSLGSQEDRLVQWCHGAPGLIPTLLKAESALGGGGRYLGAARRAAEAVWARGMLTKGVGLCHGISGSGYALLSMYRATGEQRYLEMAQAFAVFAAERWQELYEEPDRPASLYEGLAGAVSLWLDVVDPDNSRWPGAEL
ncbi:MAG: Lanthionine synthetase C-like protein [Monoraphidium minutum]|nr:MAG: Lanthionine synthetase C-like protein [Monoraphidium minutum]